MGARILIIEDNPANSELMGYMLSAFGHTALFAENGEDGLKLIRAEMPDLVVCDIHLPGIDGYEVARRVKAQPPLRGIPLVAVTALAMVGDRERVLAAGFDGYISKPIDPETFMAHIDDYLHIRLRATGPALAAGQAAIDVAVAAPVRARILVVDDRPINLSLIRNILEPLGYSLITAATVADGLRLARESRPDAIVSDVQIGDHTGFDFLKAAKADPALRNIPFILNTSTQCNEAARSRGLSLGAARFLFRPIDPAVLVAEIEACLPESRKS
jgi:two-component system, cell cycle response regulator